MLMASVNLSLASVSCGSAATASTAMSSPVTSERHVGMAFSPGEYPPWGGVSGGRVQRPPELNPRHILSLSGRRTSLGFALGLAGGEHGTEVVVDRRGASG